MKRVQFLLSVLGFLLVLNASAQKQGYEFRTSSVSAKSQLEVGQDYRYVEFVIKDLKTPMQKQALQKVLSANPQIKKGSINSVNEFHGFIHKDLKATDVRKILQAEGCDFKFDDNKFKGRFVNEELRQNFKK